MKLTYIDYSQDISPDDVDRYIRSVSLVPYRDMKLNESNSISVIYDVSVASDHKHSTNIGVQNDK